jgi:hypothetical protein
LFDEFSNLEYDTHVQFNDMAVQLRPLTYQEYTKAALKTFEEQRIFNLVNDERISDEDKLQAFTNSFTKLTQLTVDMVTQGIVKISIDDQEVTNRAHIDEFVRNADKDFFTSVTKHLEIQKDKYSLKPLVANASPEEIEKGVPKTYEVPITFDQSNFFA